MKKKISTAGPAEGLAGLFDNADLSALGDLPESPSTSATEVPQQNVAGARAGSVILRKEKSGRGGKTVIVAYDFSPGHGSVFLENLVAKGKKSLAIGGNRVGDHLEFQTSEPARIRAFLEQQGFRVRGI